jgi:TIR domain
MAEAVGFWSYVREDDEGDHGRILALADDLREQYRIQTAEKLGLFVDRQSVEWGEEWKKRIDTAIAGTTFFLPVITPSYLQSPECRRELLKFVREAERLGLTQLLMSVYWVTVPALESNPEDSDDEAIRFLAKYNWQDLRNERLEERDSSAYRKAVTALAKNLSEHGELAREVADEPNVPQAAPAVRLSLDSTDDLDDDEGAPGVIESFITTEEVVPKAGALLQGITKHMESASSMMQAFQEQLEEAQKRGKDMRAVLVLTNRLAHELSEPSNGVANDGRQYRQVLAELDPAIQTQLALIGSQKDDLTPEYEEYLQEIAGLWNASKEAQEGFESVVEGAEAASTFSRSLKKPLKGMRSGMLAVIDGNAIIEEWGRRASELLPDDDARD